MREGWKKLLFDEVISFSQIGIVRNAKQQSDEYPFRYLKMSNIKNDNGLNEESFSFIEATDEELSKYSLEQGDFLFNTRNSYDLVGKTCLYESNYQKPTLFNNNILRVRFKDYLIPKFVAYAFSSFEVIQDLEEMKSGTTSVVGIYYKSLKNLKIPIPPLPEQKRIVEILDEAFEAIDQAKANIERNIQNAEELFQSKLNEIFSQKGEGWDEKRLGDLCKTSAGGTPLKSKKHYYEGGKIPWLRSGEVNNRNIIDSEIKITEEGLNNSSAKLFPARTVLVAMYGATAGQVGILNFECSTNQAVCGILPNDNFIPEFLYYKFLEIQDLLISRAIGGAQPNISQTKIKEVSVPVVDIETQKRVVIALDDLINQKLLIQSKYQKKKLSLEELKKSILQKAFSGELTANEEVAA